MMFNLSKTSCLNRETTVHTSILASLRLSFKVRYSINKSLSVEPSVSESVGGEVDMGLDNDEIFFKNNGYYPVVLKTTGSSESCKYTISRKNYEEAKSRALTLKCIHYKRRA